VIAVMNFKVPYDAVKLSNGYTTGGLATIAQLHS
jgi:hypothetical protein